MIIGHHRILDFLKKSVQNNRLAHAYLFTGSSNLGKKTVALEFIRMLNGDKIDKKIHPDILIVEPEISEKEGIKKELEIGIDKVRKVQHQLSLFPYQSKYKIALIDQAEKMTAQASNCLLKTLEEPTGKSVLILISSRPQSLLETIVSRCQLIKFLAVAEKEILLSLREGALPEDETFPRNDRKLQQIIRLANGRPGLVISYLKNPELLEKQEKMIIQLEKIIKAGLNERYQFVENLSKNVPQARQIINQWLFWFRDLILLNSNCPDLVIFPSSVEYRDNYSLLKLKNVIQAIKRTDYLLANSSINAKLALEVLMLEI